MKLFADGEVVDEFIGALPEPQVRTWLAKAVPNETSSEMVEAQEAFDCRSPGQSDEALRTEILLR